MKTFKTIPGKLLIIKAKMIFYIFLLLSPIYKLFGQDLKQQDNITQNLPEKSGPRTDYTTVDISRNDSIPISLKYAKNHQWIKINGDHALIGITKYAQDELGDIVLIEVKTVGKTINQEESYGTIEAVKTTSDIFMPVSGKILEFNESLIQKPEIINKDPYGKGWIIKVQLTNPEEVKHLLNAEQYFQFINKN
jgi:glycine cleavage system H protein